MEKIGKTYGRRVLSIVLTFLLIVSVFINGVGKNVNANGIGEETTPWTGGVADINSLSGDGSAASPFIIDSAEKFALLAAIFNENYFDGSEPFVPNAIASNYSGKEFKITKDIVMSDDLWYSIGTEARPFTGKLNGNGSLLKKLVQNSDSGSSISLFGTVSGGSISNLTIDDTTEFSSTGNSGIEKGKAGNLSIISSITGMSTISQVTNNANLTSTAVDVGDGGNIGFILTSSGEGNTYTNIINNGNFISQGADINDHVWNPPTGGGGNGGLVAGIITVSDSFVVLNQCSNNGDLFSLGGNASYVDKIAKSGPVGGAIAYSKENAAITNFNNAGELKAFNSGGKVNWKADFVKNDVASVGGTIGLADKDATVKNSSNTGNISSDFDETNFRANYNEDISVFSTTDAGNIGGCIGSISGMAKIEQFENSGSLQANSIETGNNAYKTPDYKIRGGYGGNVGGIIAVSKGGAEITSSSSSRTLTANGSDTKGGAYAVSAGRGGYVGGAIAIAKGPSTVDDFSSTGSFEAKGGQSSTGEAGSGGIVGTVLAFSDSSEKIVIKESMTEVDSINTVGGDNRYSFDKNAGTGGGVGVIGEANNSTVELFNSEGTIQNIDASGGTYEYTEYSWSSISPGGNGGYIGLVSSVTNTNL